MLPLIVQIEQLHFHAVKDLGASTSHLIVLQWHPPLWVTKFEIESGFESMKNGD